MRRADFNGLWCPAICCLVGVVPLFPVNAQQPAAPTRQWRPMESAPNSGPSPNEPSVERIPALPLSGHEQANHPPAMAENPPIPPLTPTLAAPMTISLADDFHAWPRQFCSDVRSVFRVRPLTDIGIGAVFAGVSANNWDAEVRHSTQNHPNRWGYADNILDVIGHPLTQAGVAGTMYAASLVTDNETTHEFSKSLLSALIITDIGATGLKYAFDTTRPNGQDHGFPSGHTASSFAMAAVIDDRCGTLPGLGAYMVAGMVAWQRIDDRKHDLSDVIFGAAFGCAIGKAVSANHRLVGANFQLHPYSDPENRAYGLMIERGY